MTDAQTPLERIQVLLMHGQEFGNTSVVVSVEDLAAVLKTVPEASRPAPEVMAADGNTVRQFIDERVRYVESARQHRGENNQGDYWRWQGHMEARRQLAMQLGWAVPHEFGDHTGPASALAAP